MTLILRAMVKEEEEEEEEEEGMTQSDLFRTVRDNLRKTRMYTQTRI